MNAKLSTICEIKLGIKNYLTCKTDNTIYQFTNSLDENVKEEIMDLKIFNERIQNGIQEEKQGIDTL